MGTQQSSSPSKDGNFPVLQLLSLQSPDMQSRPVSQSPSPSLHLLSGEQQLSPPLQSEARRQSQFIIVNHHNYTENIDKNKSFFTTSEMLKG